MQKHFSTSIIALISIILFSVIASGGCSSSSSHNFSPNTNLQNANAIFSGTWSITSGTAQITMNGETDNLTIKDYDFHFSSCDLEDSEGTATLSTFTIMKGSMKGTNYISAFLDNENIITERNGNSWTFTMEGVKTLNMELVSETEANITGIMYLNDYVIDPDGDPIPCNVNIAMKKDTASTPALDVESTLTGLWQTVDSNGKYLESGGTVAYWGDAVSFEEVFSSLAFKNIDTAKGNADFAMYSLFKSLDDKKVVTLLSYSDDEASKCKISHMFANIYKIESSFIAENQREFYAMKINDENTASLIMHEIDESPNASDDAYSFEGHMILSLHKKPDNMTVNLSDDMAGSVWSAQDGNASFIYDDLDTNDYDDEIEVNTLTLTINSVDVSDNSLNVVLAGTLNNSDGQVEINKPLKLTWAGYYNMWYGETDSEDFLYFSLSLLTKDTAVFVADIRDNDAYYIEISSTLKKE